MRMGIKVDVKQALKIQKWFLRNERLYNTFGKNVSTTEQKFSSVCNFDNIWRLIVSIASRKKN